MTGVGAVSALGHGVPALWGAIEAGRDGFSPVERFPLEGFAVRIAGTVPGTSTLPAGGLGELCARIAWQAAREALDQARAGPAGVPAHRIALVLGTSLAAGNEGLHRLAEALGDLLQIAGPRLTVSTACASSTTSLGVGRDLLAAGLADLVLAGGADVLSDQLFAGFHALGVLSAGPCAPFSEPPGTTLGEGAGFLVLERQADAAARGVAPLGWILGHGLSADAYHPTSPDPTGAGVARALRAALADAGVEPAAVGYYNAHGTGTAANDPAEWQALQSVFGEVAARLPVSSSKSFLGHAQGAAGVLEAICTLEGLRRGRLPPTLHHTRPRPRSPVDAIPGPGPRPSEARVAASGSSAFGGANASLVLARADARLPPPAPDRPVRLIGGGVVGPFGQELGALARLLAEGRQAAGPTPPPDLRALLPAADPRGLDPSSRFLAAAAALALADAGVQVRGPLRDRTGLLAGIARLSPSCVEAFERSIRERGLARLDATAFTHMVLNAPAGACARLLQLRGPSTVLTTGPGSGLAAVVMAADLLAHGEGADLLLAGGLDELTDAERALRDGRAEGASCALLAGPGHLAADHPAAGRAVRVAGWGLAGPGRLDDAVAAALARAGLEPGEVSLAFGEAEPSVLAGALAPGTRVVRPSAAAGRADGAGGVTAVLLAARAIWQDGQAAALAVSDQGRSTSSAVLLTRGEA